MRTTPRAVRSMIAGTLPIGLAAVLGHSFSPFLRFRGGKGNLYEGGLRIPFFVRWPGKIQPGRVLYEIEGVTEEVAREAFKLAAAKLPVQTTFVSRTVM